MTHPKLQRPRFLQRLYAWTHNYFWLDCPMCGKKFGGHECADESLYTGGGSGWAVCKECGYRAKEASIPIWRAEGVVAINGEKI